MEHHRTVDAIVNSVEPFDATFANVLLPIAKLENKQSGERAIISALRYASSDAETQHWPEYASTVLERPDLFQLIQSVNNGNMLLDSESSWLLDRTLLRNQQCGYGLLHGNDSRTWRNWSSKIEELCAEFNRNIREYVPVDILFTAEQLAGLPDKAPKGFPRHDSGKRRVKLRVDNCLTPLRYAQDPETRKRIQLGDGRDLRKMTSIQRNRLAA
ncbi:hypothetical protein J3459_010313 [Metarhizium acridum]|uniref:uncharacterized protein n=1 Tax=Metarhizium acridum TaxID=92637 RepID=UPI001C6C2E74|nr:hypothetical protein J3459_010313 [Metarhizium acridum]KAG8424956.1 hypothetical protein J3458_001706 [Metarhizium acridum]